MIFLVPLEGVRAREVLEAVVEGEGGAREGPLATVTGDVHFTLKSGLYDSMNQLHLVRR